MVTFRKQLANFYSEDDKELNELLQVIFPLAGITIANILGTQVGAVLAIGIQQKLVPIFIIVQWLIALPVALVLSFKYEYGVKGIFTV